MVPTDCVGDGTPASKGITLCALRGGGAAVAVGLNEDPVGGDGGAVVQSGSTRSAGALAYVVGLSVDRLGGVREVLLMATSMPVAEVIVKPDAKVVATRPVAPPSSGPLTGSCAVAVPMAASNAMKLNMDVAVSLPRFTAVQQPAASQLTDARFRVLIRRQANLWMWVLCEKVHSIASQLSPMAPWVPLCGT